MTITKAIYQGKGRVEATHMRSEVTVNTDAGKAVGGLGENQTPVELLGNALAACVLTLMGLQAAMLKWVSAKKTWRHSPSHVFRLRST